jgi:NOL1/NOP2/sun family putative RNA methylase
MQLKQIPGSEKIIFKQKFIDRYSKLTNWELFKKYSLSFLRKSVRVNTLKISVAELRKRMPKDWVFEQVPWCSEGFWIEHKKGRLDIGNTIEHCLGYIYVQESASMIPPIILEPKPGERILDVAASPGSKTTQISQMMRNEGAIFANDITGDRLAALGINLQRVGAKNCAITQMRGEQFGNTGIEFDKILLDAPCSGTGTIRKSLKTIEMWNPDMVRRLSNTQKALIASAFKALRSGGTLVYSTCSNEPEENEGVIDWLLGKFTNAKLQEISLDIKRSPTILEFEGKSYNPEIGKCLRIWPQDNDTEGFFVAKILKE